VAAAGRVSPPVPTEIRGWSGAHLEKPRKEKDGHKYAHPAPRRNKFCVNHPVQCPPGGIKPGPSRRSLSLCRWLASPDGCHCFARLLPEPDRVRADLRQPCFRVGQRSLRPIANLAPRAWRPAASASTRCPSTPSVLKTALASLQRRSARPVLCRYDLPRPKRPPRDGLALMDCSPEPTMFVH